MRRLFTARQARQLFVACNGRCQKCNEELADGWHVHHVKPFSKGGQTVLPNAMALCPGCHKEVHQ